MKKVLFCGEYLPHMNFNVQHARGTQVKVNYNTH